MYESQPTAGPDDRTGRFDATLSTDAELRAIYREPSRPAVAKEIDHLDANCAAFIAHSPFVVVSTADADGRCDASPRGGPAYIHCGKALRRAGLWDPGAWPDRSALPTIACMLRDHHGLPGMDTAAVERRLEDSYSRTMWLPGGDTPRITGDDPARDG